MYPVFDGKMLPMGRKVLGGGIDGNFIRRDGCPDIIQIKLMTEGVRHSVCIVNRVGSRKVSVHCLVD